MANTETGSCLPRVPHTPADDDEIENYAAGVVNGVMRSATLNVVAALLSRIRSDAEQLSELRRAGTSMLGVLEMYKERHLVPPHFLNALADLRDALAGVDRTATVQCADCLAWFDKNTNHTCRQQVRRNQRSVK